MSLDSEFDKLSPVGKLDSDDAFKETSSSSLLVSLARCVRFAPTGNKKGFCARLFLNKVFRFLHDNRI